MRWIVPPFISAIYALLGTPGGGFRVTVWVLSWIYKFGGTLYVIFPPSVAPYTIPCLLPPSFHSRLHNHCTAHKGLSSQVQPRLARIKERFQLKMFFPSLFCLPPRSCFPFSSHVLQFFLLLAFVAHFSRMFPSCWPIFFSIYPVPYSSKRAVFKMEKHKSLLPACRVCPLP